jgi:lipopolysaccharide export system permease protein
VAGAVHLRQGCRGNTVPFGILQRYVVGEVFRAFALALTTVTIIFVLSMVMAEATKLGLTPNDILNLIPYVIPGSLPYTIPVSMLFAVSVVFGRLASDNEIVAVKTAGLSAWTVLSPAMILGAILSGILLFLSSAWIPECNHKAKEVVFKNLEEMFYKLLKKDREFNNPRWPFLIKVRDVEGKTMNDATFKHRAQGIENRNTFDMTVKSKTAIINFDMEHAVARVHLTGAEIMQSGNQDSVALLNNELLEIPLPDRDNGFDSEKRTPECSTAEMIVQQAEFRRLIAKERKRQAMAASLWIASGRIGRVNWTEVQRAFIDYKFWERKWNEYETEKQMRVSLACGSFFFVLLGAPVGILFARRDFLSAFISCFLPIILLYYPLTLLGTNLARDGMVNPTIALWLGNWVLFTLSVFAVRPVIRH